MELSDMPATNQGWLVLSIATARNGDAYALAVRPDGGEYVTWRVSPPVKGKDVPAYLARASFYWGAYYSAASFHGQGAAFARASADLVERAGGRDAVIRWLAMGGMPVAGSQVS